MSMLKWKQSLCAIAVFIPCVAVAAWIDAVAREWARSTSMEAATLFGAALGVIKVGITLGIPYLAWKWAERFESQRS